MGEQDLDWPQDRVETLECVPVVALSRSQQRLLRRIQTRKGREAERVVLLEGPRVLETAVLNGAEILFTVMEEGRAVGMHGQIGPDPSRQAQVVTIAQGGLREFVGTESPQGLLAVAREPSSDLPPILGLDSPAAALVLDGVRDPGNAGTLVRAAAALGVGRVLALDGTVDLWGAKAVRASAGLVFRIPVHSLDWPSAASWIEAAGLPLLVADPRGRDVRDWLTTSEGQRICGVDPRRASWALLVGNETAGPRPESLAAAAVRLAIPVSPGADSLNAAMAGSILLWSLGPAAVATARGSA